MGRGKYVSVSAPAFCKELQSKHSHVAWENLVSKLQTLWVFFFLNSNAMAKGKFKTVINKADKTLQRT